MGSNAIECRPLVLMKSNAPLPLSACGKLVPNSNRPQTNPPRSSTPWPTSPADRPPPICWGPRRWPSCTGWRRRASTPTWALRRRRPRTHLARWCAARPPAQRRTSAGKCSAAHSLRAFYALFSIQFVHCFPCTVCSVFSVQSAVFTFCTLQTGLSQSASRRHPLAHYGPPRHSVGRHNAPAR